MTQTEILSSTIAQELEKIDSGESNKTLISSLGLFKNDYLGVF